MLAGVRIAHKKNKQHFTDMVVEVLDQTELGEFIDEIFEEDHDACGAFSFHIDDNCPLTLEQLNEMPLRQVLEQFKIE